ncbi:protein-disulfide reductase DsbD [Crenobacter sp. SG2303]|uniref:Thiol:disulfide interchange protein DsbD n=1 Tax=Crenobacter oryzisoli TaxID=3056844 RepID=A0ABT7XR31_9NEIS|nr:protein-disulfide reductase DsbD [Crenobacter sp. SG2303]MDN0076263.1 protein-disulfide reductase DsbD [Crenobacter sp. SG2303]
MSSQYPFRLWRGLCAVLLMLAPLFAHAVSPDDLLPPDKAFAASVKQTGQQLTVRFKIADGYYLYRDRMSFVSQPADLVGKPDFPNGQEKHDAFFGKQTIFKHEAVITLPVKAGAPSHFALKAVYQGCAEVGVCYPPQTHLLEVGTTGKINPLEWLEGSNRANAPPATEAATTLSRMSIGATLGTFFVAGLALAFTACMYPLLPILSSLIAGHGQTLTRRRGFLLALAYVQGLALSYTAVGVTAGMTGALLTVWLQQPAVILSAAALMVVFALAMFDVFSIQLPATLQSRLADVSNRLPGGHYVTVFAMGALSALIIGPCVAPPLALALGYIGSTGDALLGGLALYVMALGLGLPLLVVGIFGGTVLPRAGSWMKTIKSGFGVVMLALAIYLASPFLPAWLAMLGWAALSIGCAVFLKVFESLNGNATAWHKLGKALGVLLLLAGVGQLTGALSGSTDPRQPLKGLFAGSSAASTEALSFQTVRSIAELDAAIAASAGKPVLLDVYADWCVSCKELETDTFTNPQVAAKLRTMTLLRTDVTANSAADQILLKRFGLFGPPGLILFGVDGKEAHRVIGFVPAKSLLATLNRIAA